MKKFSVFGKYLKHDYFIHEDGRYMLSIIDIELDHEIWCGEIPKIQYERVFLKLKKE